MAENEKIKVILCDDHKILREGLRKLFELEEDIEVIAEAESGEEAIDKAAQLQPDIVLMDINMPTLNGVSATRKIKQENPKIAVIILTVYADEKYLYEAIKAGAMGYLLKDISSNELIEAMRTVYSGGALIQPSMASKFIKEFSSLKREAPEEQFDMFSLLSDREEEVLGLIGKGSSNKQIAQMLEISEKTVKNHISSIFAKLQVNSRTQAVLQAIKRGKLKVE